VDGASQDRSREILEDLATTESRLTLISENRIGPGLARNVGARHARGRYIWFVDGDDELVPDCLTPISRRLSAQQLDVLVVDHAMLLQDREGEVLRPGLDHRLIAGADSTISALSDSPWLVDLSLVCWNKIIGREFFTLCGATFEQAWPHEDVPVSCALLLGASRIGVLDQVCYHYRRWRPGSATAAGARDRHFRVFDVWRPILERVMHALTARDGEGNELHRRFFERAISHCSAVLESPGYVGRKDGRRFFGEISKLYWQYLPPGYQLPGGFRGVRFWLIARNLYPAYVFLAPPNRLRVALAGLGARRSFPSVRATSQLDRH
jgi:glycosyltransferase involved in cell wall biosynthesis